MEAVIDEQDLPLVEGRNWNWVRCTAAAATAAVAPATTGPQTPLCRMIARRSGPWREGQPRQPRPPRLPPAEPHRPNDGRAGPANRKMGTVNGRKYTSKYKGVSWSEQRGKWVAQITKGDVHRLIGRFDDELAAAEAYDEAARELFGEHAYLNFPHGIDGRWSPPHRLTTGNPGPRRKSRGSRGRACGELEPWRQWIQCRVRMYSSPHAAHRTRRIVSHLPPFD